MHSTTGARVAITASAGATSFTTGAGDMYSATSAEAPITARAVATWLPHAQWYWYSDITSARDMYSPTSAEAAITAGAGAYRQRRRNVLHNTRTTQNPLWKVAFLPPLHTGFSFPKNLPYLTHLTGFVLRTHELPKINTRIMSNRNWSRQV